MTQEIQYSFKRYEIKFLLKPEQFQILYGELQKHMQEDVYGVYPICNVYFDTPDYRLIRRSLDKPVYKEKFRLRSYGPISEEDEMFAEIKKNIWALSISAVFRLREAITKKYSRERISLEAARYRRKSYNSSVHTQSWRRRFT